MGELVGPLVHQFQKDIIAHKLVYDAMTDQVVKFVSKVKIQNFQKAQNDPQMTSKWPSMTPNEHLVNPQWLPMTISWDLFGFQML